MKRTKTLALFLSILALFCGAARAQETGKTVNLVAAGSGVNLGITRLLAEGFMKTRPDVRIEVPGSIGTKGAITAVGDGAVTLGLTSRPLKESEKRPDVVEEVYARSPVVLGVHQSVPDDNLSSRELVDIYDAKKKKWADGSDIVVYTREPTDSGVLVLMEKIPGFKAAFDESYAQKRWFVFFTDQDSNQAVAKTPHALGFTDLGMIATEKLAIKPLKLDGVEPSVENLRAGRYPLDRALFLLYKPAQLPKEAKAFIDFIRSDEGRKILEKNGYLPENPK